MTPIDINTSAVYYSNGFPTGEQWKVPSKRRGFKLSLTSGGHVLGYGTQWGVMAGNELEEYHVYMLVVPEHGFASCTRVAKETIFEEKDMFFLSIYALTTCMNEHGYHCDVPDLPEFLRKEGLD